MGISDFINVVFTQPIFNVLMLLYHLFCDFGVSIIVLTLIIRLILFPLTLQQLKSARAMQELQPELSRIRERYKDDLQAQMAATQELYRRYNINPYSGCLPLLLQLPVLYGLYFAFRAVIDDASLKGTQGLERLNGFIYPFLPKFSHFPNVNLDWFTFINPSWHLSLALPDETHILPILAALATFVQLYLTQSRTTPSLATASSSGSRSSDALAAQQQTMKIMTWFMPLLTLFFAWSFPAGLALYWAVGSILMAIQYYLVTGPASPFSLSRKTEKDLSQGEQTAQTRLLDETTESQEAQVALSNEHTLRNNATSASRRHLRSASARRRGVVRRRNPTLS
ncbi:YidC/Oxa1 family membrane protein insertase [Thermogemmatispora sp.]|uniref:YidC/Oxa1 family membrane protein insertase n=1 Tax=Thermogemmatispora sp. TaxID=1968838 RepID=UPI002ACC2570|nr:YidC/Oxa1 family membrane protein insertase [Thermogemmatispora sp.]